MTEFAILSEEQLTRVVNHLDGKMDKSHAIVFEGEDNQCVFLPVKGIGSVMEDGNRDIGWIMLPGLASAAVDLAMNGSRMAHFTFCMAKGRRQRDVHMFRHPNGKSWTWCPAQKKGFEHMCGRCETSMNAGCGFCKRHVKSYCHLVWLQAGVFIKFDTKGPKLVEE